MSSSDIEGKSPSAHYEYVMKPQSEAEGLKLDPHGYPLRPQPSDDHLGKEKAP